MKKHITLISIIIIIFSGCTKENLLLDRPSEVNLGLNKLINTQTQSALNTKSVGYAFDFNIFFTATYYSEQELAHIFEEVLTVVHDQLNSINSDLLCENGCVTLVITGVSSYESAEAMAIECITTMVLMMETIEGVSLVRYELYWEYSGGPLFGGGGTPPPQEENPLLWAPEASKIFNTNSNFTKEQWMQLEAMLTGIVRNANGNIMPFMNKLLQHLQGKNINIVYDPNTYSGFLPTTNTLSLQSLNNEDYFVAELFHALQDAVLPGGTQQYMSNSNGRISVEFEEKVFGIIYHAEQFDAQVITTIGTILGGDATDNEVGLISEWLSLGYGEGETAFNINNLIDGYQDALAIFVVRQGQYYGTTTSEDVGLNTLLWLLND